MATRDYNDLFQSCMEGKFPTLKVMSQFGMDGCGGTNPLDIFNCYKTALKEGKLNIEDLKKSEDINKLILTYNKTKKYYRQVQMAGGIQFTVKIPEHVECPQCNFCGVKSNDQNICPNCQLKF